MFLEEASFDLKAPRDEESTQIVQNVITYC